MSHPTTWLDDVTAKHGEPRLNMPDGVSLGTRTRQCWGWLTDGQSRNVAIDAYPDCWVLRCGGPGISVQVTTYQRQRPTDDQLRHVVTLGGLL